MELQYAQDLREIFHVGLVYSTVPVVRTIPGGQTTLDFDEVQCTSNYFINRKFLASDLK